PQDAVKDMVEAFNNRRKLVFNKVNQIAGLSCIEPAGAFYSFVNISKIGVSAQEMQDILLNQAHVVTIAGTSFGHLGEGYIRLSYANSEANIERALARIEETLYQLPKT
ncbi:MAG: aminotransferase class I/II-fold pyridoxal phosphate-dependent enzyme, partial [Alphaproteobacteria bacterium]|nr:aminotransferase class I/II-fold pyridoxal phosphate-dependent enzyme [Alphaproteobacteria bacterium]